MAALIKSSEIKWLEPVRVRFGFSGLTPDYAVPIVRQLLRDQWPEVRRPTQCVYVIRLRGEVSVAYGSTHSPVVYIGEGSAYDRLYNHANWLSTLLVSVPNIEIEVRIAEVARRNHTDLYRYIEADLIKWFISDVGMLPWFNRQREKSKEGHYDYDKAAEQELRRHLGIGAGNAFLWAIQPTHNNDQFEPYNTGPSVNDQINGR
jgi:hypothetical protein